jgi:T4 gene Gp59 loader of gp41 DNA helicase
MTENTGFEAYRLWNALKLHFTSDSYDYFKYNGKTNVSKNTFMTNKSKYHFYKLSRKYSMEELKDFYVANFIVGKGDWVGELTQDGDENYTKWQKRIQSLTYNFENDIIYLFDLVDGAESWTRDDLLKPYGGGWPIVITKLMKNKVSLESVCILVDLVGCMPRWEKQITEDIIWPTWHRLITKYTPFIQYDKQKFLKILKEKIAENV